MEALQKIYVIVNYDYPAIHFLQSLFYEFTTTIKSCNDFILYLNSSRAAPRVGISITLQQAVGNSNLN